jgi:hypothetical protein
MANRKYTYKLGSKFGRFTVIGVAPDIIGKTGISYPAWLCRCECGVEKRIIPRNLINGSTVSCGCYWRQAVTKHGACATRTYQAWDQMKQRHSDPKRDYADLYCGMEIDPLFSTFEGFLSVLGECPPGMTLDRKDNSRGYLRDNVRWATMTQQQRNKTNNRMVTFRGETKCLAEWCEAFNRPYHVIHSRLSIGWTIERALTTATKEGWYNGGSRKRYPRKSPLPELKAV